MTITRGIAAAAMLVGLAAGTAWADTPTMSGHYIKTTTAPGTQPNSIDWYASSCGSGCVAITTAPGGQPLAQARLVNGQWTMDVTSDAACTDGSRVPNAEASHYTWDPYTLAGIVKITDKFAICGNSAPGSFTNNVQLRQAP